MNKLLLCLLVLVSQSSFADLYKCSTESKTSYQDKPCPATQIQTVIAQQPHQSHAQPAALPDNTAQIERDVHGRIKRSERVKADFKARNPCPANGKRIGACPGYVIDHIKPLACGGADSPENMQWQTVEAGKEKDAWERDNCSLQTKPATPQPPMPDKISASRQTDSPATNPETQTVYTGRRGGRYVMTKTGKKRYLGHKY